MYLPALSFITLSSEWQKVSMSLMLLELKCKCKHVHEINQEGSVCVCLRIYHVNKKTNVKDCIVGILRKRKRNNYGISMQYNRIFYNRRSWQSSTFKTLTVKSNSEGNWCIILHNFRFKLSTSGFWLMNRLWLVGTWMRNPGSRSSPSCNSKDHPIPLGAFK